MHVPPPTHRLRRSVTHVKKPLPPRGFPELALQPGLPCETAVETISSHTLTATF